MTALPHRFYINPELHMLEEEAETCIGCIHMQVVKGVERCQNPDVKSLLALKRCADYEDGSE